MKILDFGLARFVSESSRTGGLTEYGTVMGTPDFIAPEQADDARTADIRADIYSLGCTLYFLLVGRTPFPDGSIMQKLIAHRERTPRPLTDFRSDVPAGVVRVLERMMAKPPAQRYQTPREVADALAPFACPSMVSTVLASDVMQAEPCEPDGPDAGPEPLPVALAVPPPRSSKRIHRPDGGKRTGGPAGLRTALAREVLPDALPNREDLPVVESEEKPALTAMGLGIASLVLGIIAVLFSWVPCMGVLTIPVSLIGLLLGCVGTVMSLFQRSRGLGFAVAGAIVSLVALILTVVITWLLSSLFPSAGPTLLGP